MAIAFAVCNQVNKANIINLRIERKYLPAAANLFFDYINSGTAKVVAEFFAEADEETQVLNICDLTILSKTKGQLHCHHTAETSFVLIASKIRFSLPHCNQILTSEEKLPTIK